MILTTRKTTDQQRIKLFEKKFKKGVDKLDQVSYNRINNKGTAQKQRIKKKLKKIQKSIDSLEKTAYNNIKNSEIHKKNKFKGVVVYDKKGKRKFID